VVCIILPFLFRLLKGNHWQYSPVFFVFKNLWANCTPHKSEVSINVI